MTAKRRLGTTGYYVVSILIAVVAMIPFLWMISTSLKSRGALMSIPLSGFRQSPRWMPMVRYFPVFHS